MQFFRILLVSFVPGVNNIALATSMGMWSTSATAIFAGTGLALTSLRRAARLMSRTEVLRDWVLKRVLIFIEIRVSEVR
jgi:Kef-type K+ transport system membrane component KefB